MTGNDVLLSSQSPFWTTEKYLHMACLISTMTQSCVRLFSVSHFAPTDDWYPSSEGFINYSLTDYSFYDNCIELRVSSFSQHLLISSRLEHIQTLSLECSTDSINQLQELINFLSVTCLKFTRSVQCTIYHTSK